MIEPGRKLVLVDPEERLPLTWGSSALYYRRLSLGALASLERSLTVLRHARDGMILKAEISPAALEAAICAHVLVDWEGVLDPRNGKEVAFGPGMAGRLPARARSLLVQRAQELMPPKEQE